MGGPRKKSLIRSRRRLEDDGEEEDGSVAAALEEDSLSEGSAMSDVDDDADAEASDGSDIGSPLPEDPKQGTVANGHREKVSTVAPQPIIAPGGTTLAMTDTTVMMNGLKLSSELGEQGVHFDDLGKESEVQISDGVVPQDKAEVRLLDSTGERRRREHEEYRKKRDADPAFVPNRGGFFMHDHRSAAPGQNGFRPFGRGRGRGFGRGAIGGSSLSTGPSQTLGAADAPWAHDLHETVAQSDIQTAAIPKESFGPNVQQISTSSTSKAPLPNRSFSKTTRIGNIQIRVFLRGMSDPIVFSAVPVNQHTRLPHHRPPLRRDKPVRISIPDMPLRYIFPSTERSFIFIPRALRPNQQGFGRIRGRGSFGGSYNAFGGMSSRRTSAYAGSGYSPSVAPSRRSSLARDVHAEGTLSPGTAAVPRFAPVVRLPPAAEQNPPAQQQASLSNLPPTVNLPQATAYPVQQKLASPEKSSATLPMHHPKPERTLQIAELDSPATLEFNPPQQQQQLPFHQQVPQIAGQVYPPEYSQLPHSRHPSHPSQASGGTPLPQIPERAIHAQPFQPYPYQQPPNFYPQQFLPPVYYYPASDQAVGAPHAAAPAFVPGQPYAYPMPLAPPPPLPPPSQQTEPTTQAGMIAHESNGMVYYYDSSQLAAGTESNPPYAPAGFALSPPGGVVGMGGMMTPPIFYPPPAAYYPPQ